jgi:hypothetical protein
MERSNNRVAFSDERNSNSMRPYKPTYVNINVRNVNRNEITRFGPFSDNL